MPIRCYPKLPEAETLLSMVGIRDDLEQVDAYCKVLQDQRAGPRDLALWEGLTAAALIAYGRCFGGGVRQWLGEEALDGAPEELLKAHRFYLALRNKHVAHSVNAYEEHRLVAVLDGPPPDRAVFGVEVKSVRVQAMSGTELDVMRRLVAWLLGYVRPKFEQESDRVLGLLRMVPTEELLQLTAEHLPAFLLDEESHMKPRARY